MREENRNPTDAEITRDADAVGQSNISRRTGAGAPAAEVSTKGGQHDDDVSTGSTTASDVTGTGTAPGRTNDGGSTSGGSDAGGGGSDAGRG